MLQIAIVSLTVEIKRLNENFQKLESDVSVIKNVNNILSKQMSWEAVLEKHPILATWACWGGGVTFVNSRQKELKLIVCRVLQHIGVDIMGESIEASHLLNKVSDRTIVKFSRRKDCEHVMRKESELRKSKPFEFDLPNRANDIKESLCPYCRGLCK